MHKAKLVPVQRKLFTLNSQNFIFPNSVFSFHGVDFSMTRIRETLIELPLSYSSRKSLKSVSFTKKGLACMFQT